jgi:hypothetical protein
VTWRRHDALVSNRTGSARREAAVGCRGRRAEKSTVDLGAAVNSLGCADESLVAQNLFVLEMVVEVAGQALRATRHSVGNALERCPDRPGLYAVYGTRVAWTELGVLPSYPDTPSYVGKAEDSLVRRDMCTHFTTGKTGSWTLPRSLAALLRNELDLRAIPRNGDTRSLSQPDVRVCPKPIDPIQEPIRDLLSAPEPPCRWAPGAYTGCWRS